MQKRPNKKNPRKAPVGFKDFEERTRWNIGHALDLVGANMEFKEPMSKRLNRTQQEERLRELAYKYLSAFKEHPKKVHVFPLVGSIFQYEFARGVRDGAGLDLELKTLATTSKPNRGEMLKGHTERLGLKAGQIVVHDSIGSYNTIYNIADALGISKMDISKNIDIHELDSSQTHCSARVPLHGRSIVVYPRAVFGKKTHPKHGEVRVEEPSEDGLDAKKRKIVRRNIYSAGFAAAREYLIASHK